MAITEYKENGKKQFEVYVNGRDANGTRFQRRKKGIQYRKEAEAIEFEWKRELANLRDEEVWHRWEEWHKECLERIRLQYQPSTVATYQGQLEKWVHPHWTGKEIRKITKGDVHDVIFGKGLAEKSEFTKRNVFKTVRRIFQMAVEEGILDRNPCAGITVRVSQSDSKVLTSTEVEKFLLEAKEGRHRFYPIWAMALMTGMRSGELYALKWSDIDLDASTIAVTKAWNSKCGITPTKSRRARVVPVSEDLKYYLAEAKMASRGVNDFVLPRLNEWERGEQARVTREFCEAIGITSIKFHDLRATFITNLLARGESLARVMSMVGHSELKTTNGYLRKAGVDVMGGTEKLSYKLPQAQVARVFTLVGRK